mgnify:CR=1 FL=1|jgi:hypothetical protein|tara:strand:+ start:22 stop:636 length:615 start_codon:yes stop_codon:yes gene_type:complete
MASEIKVDTISEKTSANGVTIDGVLIKDNVVTSGAGMGQFIKHQTFSSVTSVDVDDVFTATYDNYRVFINVESSATKQAKLGFRTGGASGSDHTTSSLYSGQFRYVALGASGGDTHSGQNEDNYFFLGSYFSTDSAFVVDIKNPFLGKNTIMTSTGAGSQSGTDYSYFAEGIVLNNDSLTGLRIYATDSPNLTGSVSVYGYRIA